MGSPTSLPRIPPEWKEAEAALRLFQGQYFTITHTFDDGTMVEGVAYFVDQEDAIQWEHCEEHPTPTITTSIQVPHGLLSGEFGVVLCRGTQIAVSEDSFTLRFHTQGMRAVLYNAY